MKQLRKSLAVLLATLLLMTVLPLSALVSAADVSYDGYFYNGDFEAGTENWTLYNDDGTITEVVEDPTESGQGMVMHTNSTSNNDSSLGCDMMFNQTIAMEADTDMILKFKVYCYSTATNAAFWVTIGDNTATYSTSDVTGLTAQTVSSSSSTRVRLNVSTNTGAWIDVAIPFNTGDNTSVLVRFDNYRVGAGQYYFDDITLEGPNNENAGSGDSGEGGETTSNNLLLNGDFEEGDTYWTKLVDTISVVEDPTGAGQGLVMQTNETASQTHMFQQAVSSISADTDYILKFKVYTYATSGTNPGFWATLGTNAVTYDTADVTCSPLEVKTVSSSSSTRVRFTATSTSAYNTWISVEIPFNSNTATSTTIIFSNYRADAGQYYFDDVELVRADGGVEPEPEDPETGDDETDVEGNLFTNGDFETGDTTGWSKYQSTTVNADAAYEGSYGANLVGTGGWGALIQQSADVAIGRTYMVSLWLKVVQTGVNIQIRDGGSDGTLVGSKWCSAADYGEWTELSWVVTPTTNTLLLNFCGSGAGTAEIAYLDDVSVTVAPTVTNGDFETGSLSGWTSYQSTTISTDAAYEGSYGANLIGNGGWGAFLEQTLSVTDGKTYELSFWYKVNSSGTNWSLKGNQSGTSYASGWVTATEWTQVTKTFIASGDSTLLLKFNGGGNGVAEDVYIDNVSLIEQKDPSYDGFIYNGDFETGKTAPWVTYYDTAVSADAAYEGDYGMALVGDGGWGGLMYQNFTTEVGKIYNVTMWIKAASNGVNIQIKDVSSDTSLASSWFTTTDWTQKTFEFTATGTTTRINFSGGGNSIATTVYLDNVQVVRLQDPSFDGYLYNGDFEAGSLTKWNVPYGSSSLSAGAAYSGNYGVSILGPGDWSGLLNQTFTLEAGKTYTLSFWYKPVSNGVNFKLKDADGTSLDTLYLDSRKVVTWTYYEVTFESGYSTTATVYFGGSGTGTTDEVYVDDMRVVNLSGNEMDRVEAIVFGGTSIRDHNDTPALAFKFDFAADGIAIENGNVYVNNSGTVKLYKYAEVIGSLKRFGAVITNDAAVGGTAFTLADVNGKKVIDIPVKYLMDLEDTSASFAVRVINIPNANVSNDIYARPYYVYELDGEEITIYGDVVSNNYAAVEATRRTKRVLTIGGNYEDTNDHLYNVLKSAEYDQVILGHLDGDTYYKNDDNGQWVSSTSDLSTVIADERWQVIVVNDADTLAWVNTNKPADAEVLYNIGWGDNYANNVSAAQNSGVDAMPTGTALENLDAITIDGLYDGADLSDKGDYAASLLWFVVLTDESLDLVTYIPASVGTEEYDMRRAAAHAWFAPYAISDLSEVVLVSGSDFQASTDEKGVEILDTLMDSLHNQGYGMFDGLLFGGDYTAALGSDYESSNQGLNALDAYITGNVNFDKHYTQGNHDAADIDLLPAYGNNDPVNAPYGVFLVHEDDYNAYGAGGQQVAADLTAYCNEKIANGWGNKPIFVISHLPLHYNYRTMKDKGALTASYIIEALNDASEAGLNIIFLISHNHSGGYDDYLGGGAIYIPKGDSILVPDATNVNNAPIETELKFTYMNCGYVSYYADTGVGADTALTMCTFRIQANGDVIVTRYDTEGVHNLKSAGKLSPSDPEYTSYTYADERVYESSRIVGAFKDEEYTG